MKNKGLKYACRWVAYNDSSGDDDAMELEPVSGLITVVLLADLFDVEPEHIAKKVIQIRKEFRD